MLTDLARKGKPCPLVLDLNSECNRSQIQSLIFLPNRYLNCKFIENKQIFEKCLSNIMHLLNINGSRNILRWLNILIKEQPIWLKP